jgi:hypothetical protein
MPCQRQGSGMVNGIRETRAAGAVLAESAYDMQGKGLAQAEE